MTHRGLVTKLRKILEMKSYELLRVTMLMQEDRPVVSGIYASFERASLRRRVIAWRRDTVEDASVILAAEDTLFGERKEGRKRLKWALTASAQAKEFKTGRAVVRYDPRLDRHGRT